MQSTLIPLKDRSLLESVLPPSPGIIWAHPTVSALGEPVDLLLPADEEDVPLGQHDEVVVPVQDSPGVAVYEVLELPEAPPGGYVGQLVLDGVDLLLYDVEREHEVAVGAGPVGIDVERVYRKHDAHLAGLASDAAHEGAALGRVGTALKMKFALRNVIDYVIVLSSYLYDTVKE